MAVVSRDFEPYLVSELQIQNCQSGPRDLGDCDCSPHAGCFAKLLRWADWSRRKDQDILKRHTRYQALIVENHAVLLIKHSEHHSDRSYWVIPGGGLDGHESEIECVIREAREETNLEVEVERLLLDGPGHPNGVYPWRKTYLCHPVGGEATPGFEPKLEAAERYAITEVRWFDLRDEKRWGTDLLTAPFTYPQLNLARNKLGYLGKDMTF